MQARKVKASTQGAAPAAATWTPSTRPCQHTSASVPLRLKAVPSLSKPTHAEVTSKECEQARARASSMQGIECKGPRGREQAVYAAGKG